MATRSRVGEFRLHGRYGQADMSERPTVLLCTSNGVGLGHLSRMMAVAQHLTDSCEVVIFTLSAGVSIPVAQGFRTEYLRSHEFSEFDGREWNRLLERRLDHLFEQYRPSVLMYDGTHPYAGLCRFLDRHPDIAKYWQRRGMWRPGLGEAAILRSVHFDGVIEPGDYAAEYDTGLTSEHRDGVEAVSPMRYVSSPMDRAAGRRELGLDPDRDAAIVQLGAGRINDVNSLIRPVVDHLVGAGVQVVIAASVLAQRPDVVHEGVTVVQRYPISDYFDAFDFGYFAGGYNSFHEALSCCLPSVFAPNLSTRLDAQDNRTRFADDRGLGLEWRDQLAPSLVGLTERLLDPDQRREMRERLGGLPPASGGSEVADRLRQAAFR